MKKIIVILVSVLTVILSSCEKDIFKPKNPLLGIWQCDKLPTQTIEFTDKKYKLIDTSINAMYEIEYSLIKDTIVTSIGNNFVFKNDRLYHITYISYTKIK